MVVAYALLPTITEQWPEANLPPLSETPDLMIGGLNGFENFWFPCNDNLAAKHDNLKSVGFQGLESAETVLQDRMRSDVLHVQTKQLPSEDSLRLLQLNGRQCALRALQALPPLPQGDERDNAIQKERSRTEKHELRRWRKC